MTSQRLSVAEIVLYPVVVGLLVFAIETYLALDGEQQLLVRAVRSNELESRADAPITIGQHRFKDSLVYLDVQVENAGATPVQNQTIELILLPRESRATLVDVHHSESFRCIREGLRVNATANLLNEAETGRVTLVCDGAAPLQIKTYGATFEIAADVAREERSITMGGERPKVYRALIIAVLICLAAWMFGRPRRTSISG